jgi:enoyl-CoA hydratase
MEFSTLILDRKPGYAVITLNRPDKLNALNAQTLADLYTAVTEVHNDDTIHVLVITGSGPKAFAAGADIAELHEQNGETGHTFAERGQGVFNAIELLGKPVIAAVNGFALGGGCELALACHIRFASTKAKFGQPEVNLGIIPGYGGTQRLTRLVGRAKSTELILSGNVIGAEEALGIGLVNSVHEPEALMEYTEQFVQTLLSKSQPAVRAALECIINVETKTPLEGLELEARKFGETCGTNDFKEGTQAFLEKRAPAFQHS